MTGRDHRDPRDHHRRPVPGVPAASGVPGGPVPRASGASDDRGAAALLVVATGTAALVLALLVLAAVTDVLVTAARARAAADAAALAAVSRSPLLGHPVGGALAEPPAAAARRLATANGARLVSCRCDDPLAASVEVAVRPALGAVRAVRPWLTAVASAELRPRRIDLRAPG